MNITKWKKSFLVQRIEKLNDGWKFYPVDETPKPVFISAQNFSGKLPHKFKFFWQKRIFEYEYYGDFICSASLDGTQLFLISEENYPDDIKRDLAAFQKSYTEFLEKCQKDDEQLKKDLTAYVQKFSPNSTLEEDISKLRVPLRTYLKLQLFKSSTTEISKRINLVFLLSQIAERIYKRHVKETDKKHSLDLPCCWATLRFSPTIFEDIWPDWRFDIADMEKAVGEEKTHEVFETYYEAESLISELLPPTENVYIQRYLNYLVRKLLWLLAEDWDTLQSNALRNGWSNLRICSDEQDYQYQYHKMKLLHHTNFILPEEIPQNKIDDFINHYSLA